MNTRICPNCNVLIKYKSIGYRNNAEKNNRGCRKCQYKKCVFTPNTKCSTCDKEIYRIPCRIKTETNFFCSISCRNKFYSKENSFVWKGGKAESIKKSRRVDRKRKHEKKNRALTMLGGKCSVCSYNKCLAAIDFHHKNPMEKDDTLKNLWTKKWEIIENEIKKCVLLCANCHREHHWNEYEIRT